MGPLIPRPAVTLISFMITAGMLVNIWLDADPTRNYDGGQNTITLALLVAGILGFELYRGQRRNGGGP